MISVFLHNFKTSNGNVLLLWNLHLPLTIMYTFYNRKKHNYKIINLTGIKSLIVGLYKPFYKIYYRFDKHTGNQSIRWLCNMVTQKNIYLLEKKLMVYSLSKDIIINYNSHMVSSNSDIKGPIRQCYHTNKFIELLE